MLFQFDDISSKINLKVGLNKNKKNFNEGNPPFRIKRRFLKSKTRRFRTFLSFKKSNVKNVKNKQLKVILFNAEAYLILLYKYKLHTTLTASSNPYAHPLRTSLFHFKIMSFRSQLTESTSGLSPESKAKIGQSQSRKWRREIERKEKG